MTEDDDSGEKIFEPTEQKLERARHEGEVVRSTDLAVAATYGGMVLAGAAVGAGALQRAGQQGAVLLDQADGLSEILLGGGQAGAGRVFVTLTIAVAPWFAIPSLAVLLVILAQRALIFSPNKLLPNLSRISIVANAGNKFGRDGLFEFAKSFAKLTVISVILWLFVLGRIDDLLGAVYLPPAMASALMMRLMLDFMVIVLALAVLIGGIDYLWQFHQHRRKNRMSRKEMTDEIKNSEGDPHIKQQRRQRGQEIATNRMLDDVPKADVVIVNPTHYAVALKWRRGDRGAPVCLAKGVDEIAARIRERAAGAGVPLHADPPTARALFATVEIGREITPEHYRAVAAAIRFSEAMRARARERRGW
jgi:flagellar biosynthetic protein FlhB